MSWVLVELPMDEMRVPTATMSAFVETPFDALAGVGPDDPLPIQGIAYDRGTSGDYLVDAVLAFPPTNGTNIATVDEEKKIFSILVNLEQFSAGDVIRIGLYGFIKSYEQFGAPNVEGEGKDGPFFGTVNAFTWAGVTRLDISGAAVPITPGAITGSPQGNFKIRFSDYEIPFFHCFPELAGLSHTIGGGATINALQGEPPFDPFAYVTSNVGFDWDVPGHDGAWWGDPATENPNDDPDAFIFFIGPERVTDTEWASGFLKKRHVEGMWISYLDTDIGPREIGASDVLTPPADGTLSVSISYGSAFLYSIPTWKFTNDRSVPVNVATSGTIIWTEQAKHDYPGGVSYTWETEDYPDRPEMAEIATAVIPSRDDRDGDDTPFNHFGEPRVGTITIIAPDSPSSPPTVSFEPEVVPPADGTPDGNGPIGDGTAPGRTDNPQLRVWTYSLDGHDYYVLRLGDFDQLVFDTYSEQWMDWNDYNSLTWRAQCGINWIGAEALADTYGSNIVAGDDTLGLLWFLDPEQGFDDDPFGSAFPTYFSRVTMGQVPLNGRDVLPCYAVWLTTDMGDPAYSGAAVTLWTSDDAGATWDNQGYVSVTADNNSPELSWYSLGQIGAPGRLFKIFDDGAVTRIDALEMNDPDDEK